MAMPGEKRGGTPRPMVLERLLPLSFPLILTLVIAFLFLIIPELNRPPKHLDTTTPIILDNHKRQEAIRSAFQFAWNGYYKFAFPHDELKPVSETPGTSRDDWGATAIDALGTAILMEQHDTVEIIIEHIRTLEFSQAKDDISVFESTIRYIGGLLSAYELMSGPFVSMKSPDFELDVLVKKAQALGDLLCYAFKEGQNLPSTHLNPKTLTGDGRADLANAGTLVLEWTKLSELTGNSTFATMAQNAESVFLHPKFKTAEVFPGLMGKEVDINTDEIEPSKISWGGGADSFWEYLIKFNLYDVTAYPQYAGRWVAAADSTIKYLLSIPKGVPDVTFLGEYDEELGKLIPISGHLACFAGGNFLLAGMMLENSTFTDVGLRLVEGCRYSYTSTSSRIGPELWKWIPSECGKTTPAWQCDDPPSEQHDLYNKTGIWMEGPSYNLRPEVIESYYYAYRMTRDEKYRDWAWDAWTAINSTARVRHGFTFVEDVNGGDGKGDNQESYFFSETLKYLFLIFDDGDGEWHVKNHQGRNDWVYSTEGHPLRIARH